MTEKFEAYALVELFGHQRMAGKVSEQTIGGGAFIRIDVPETKTQPGFSRLLNPSAIYAINPITLEAMTELAENLDKAPIQAWDIRETVAKAKKALEAPAGGSPEEEDEWQAMNDLRTDRDDDLPM